MANTQNESAVKNRNVKDKGAKLIESDTQRIL